MSSFRSYGDLCGIARALDVVGERWALLVVRELLLGPKRFGDLHRDLGGVSQNVLSQRLRGLEQQGLVRRTVLRPPARVNAYELTERGYELKPVLLALGRWGSTIAPQPEMSTVLSVDALAVALMTTFEPDRAGDLDAGLRLVLDEDLLHADVSDGCIQVVRGDGAHTDVTLTCGVRALQGLVFAGRSLDAAVAAGEVVVSGDTRALETFLESFVLG